MRCLACAHGKAEEEVFFFEKKNQKTFVCLDPRKTTQKTTEFTRAQEQKFFGSFFQKITLLPFHALPPAFQSRKKCPTAPGGH